MPFAEASRSGSGGGSYIREVQAMKPHIVVDFAETLVKERPMIEWVLFELRNREASLWWRFRFMLNSFTRGFLSIIFGGYPSTDNWSARIAFMSFKGVNKNRLERLVDYKKTESDYLLNLNPELISVLLKIREDRGINPREKLGISIHSQGTCAKAIELFTERDDVTEALAKSGFYISSIVANDMEVIDGKFTGYITGQVITKSGKPEGIPEGSIFVGDDRDEKAVNKVKNRSFEFVNYRKYVNSRSSLK
jgi:hypothetical protein